MDVLFLIDTSEGVSDLDFQREKNFIKTVVRSFKISSDHSRVGLMSYSNETEITVNFSDEQSHDSLLERVESLPFLGGQRQFNNALETAAAQFFSPSGSSRSVVQKAAVIITNCDQVSTKGTDHLEESSLLQENDVKVLIIAVGCDGADQENNLQKLVQDAEQIFTPDSFENLAAAAKRLTVVAADIAGSLAVFLYMDSELSMSRCPKNQGRTNKIRLHLVSIECPLNVDVCSERVNCEPF